MSRSRRCGAIVTSILVAIGLMLLASDAQAAASNCNPFGEKFQAARGLLSSRHRNLSGAKQLVGSVLSTPAGRDDFAMNYLQSLIDVNSATTHKKYMAAVATLVSLASRLNAMDQACARNADFFSIYNTIDAEYFNDGNIAGAERYYHLAFEDQDNLAPQSKAHFFGNLGQYSYYIADYACAHLAYQKALSFGDTDSDDKKMASRMKVIVEALGTKPTCTEENYFPPLLKDVKLVNGRVTDAGQNGSGGNAIYVACEVDAPSPDESVWVGYRPSGVAQFLPLVSVQKTLEHPCGKFSVGQRSGTVAAQIAKFAKGDLVEIQTFRADR